MADLSLTDEQKEYRELASNFSQKEIAPHAHAFESKEPSEINVYKQAWQLGLMNVTIPEKYGGPGFTNYEACLIVEEIAAGCTGISAAFEANHAFTTLLLLAGNDEQKELYLNKLTSDFCLAAYCLNNNITYKQTGNDFILTGKTVAINASLAEWICVFAKDTDSNRYSCFVLPTNSPGYKVNEKITLLGRNAADQKHISFTNVKANNKNLIGNIGDGLSIEKQLQTIISPYIAAQAVGLNKSALAHSITYSKERKTFGQAIANYQSISFMLSDMAKNAEAGRLLYHKAAWLIDAGESSLYHSLVSRSFAINSAVKAACDAVQIFGGYGYSREYPVEKLMRDAKVLEAQYGSSDKEVEEIGKLCLSIK